MVLTSHAIGEVVLRQYLIVLIMFNLWIHIVSAPWEQLPSR